MTLAERLLQARNYAGLRQDQLAERSGVSQQAISRLETGVQKKSTDIVELAVACGVRAEWLAMEEGEMVQVSTYDLLTSQVLTAMETMDPATKYKLIQITQALVAPAPQAVPSATEPKPAEDEKTPKAGGEKPESTRRQHFGIGVAEPRRRPEPAADQESETGEKE